PFAEQGRNNRLLFYTVIAAELALFVDLDARRGLTAEFAGRTGAITLCRHRGLETFLVYAKPAFACDVRGQVDRKAIGVVQLEHHVARQFLALQSGDRFLEDLHPLVQSLGEPGLFLRQHLFNVCPRLDEFRVSVAHFLAQRTDKLVKEAFRRAELFTVTYGTPDDAPQHVAAAFVTRDRKSTRLNSSHVNISYAVFCLKYKNM